MRFIARTYNAMGQPSYTLYQDGAITDDLTEIGWSYDVRGMPSETTWLTLGAGNPGRSLGTLTRNVAGAVTHAETGYLEKYGSGGPGTFHSVDYSYDKLGRIVSYTGSYNAQPKVSQSYVYGATDEVETVSTTLGSLAPRDMVLTYDDRHQITSANVPDSTSAGADFYGSYGYDVAGRFLTANVTAGPAVADGRPRNVEYVYGGFDPEFVTALENVSGGGYRAVYQPDAAGNVVKRGEHCSTDDPEQLEDPGVCAGGVWNFGYDGNMRQAVVDAPNGDSERYLYDAAGNRALAIRQDSGSAYTTARMWFGELEAHYDTTYTGGAFMSELSKIWTHVSAGGQTVRIENRGTATYQHTSALGHMLASVERDGEVVAGYTYGPFAEMLDTVGGETADHLRRFNGKENDQLSGLNYYGYRYFDPLSVTWTQSDPLYRFAPEFAGSAPRLASLYQFTLSNPLRLVDPDGRNPFVKRAAQAAVGYGLRAAAGERTAKLGTAVMEGAVATGTAALAAKVTEELLDPCKLMCELSRVKERKEREQVQKGIDENVRYLRQVAADNVHMNENSDGDGDGSAEAGWPQPGEPGSSADNPATVEQALETQLGRPPTKKELANYEAELRNQGLLGSDADRGNRAEQRGGQPVTGGHRSKGSKTASNKGKHQGGDRRRGRDQGGEKADERRPY